MQKDRGKQCQVGDKVTEAEVQDQDRLYNRFFFRDVQEEHQTKYVRLFNVRINSVFMILQDGF